MGHRTLYVGELWTIMSAHASLSTSIRGGRLLSLYTVSMRPKRALNGMAVCISLYDVGAGAHSRSAGGLFFG